MVEFITIGKVDEYGSMVRFTTLMWNAIILQKMTMVLMDLSRNSIMWSGPIR